MKQTAEFLKERLGEAFDTVFPSADELIGRNTGEVKVATDDSGVEYSYFDYDDVGVKRLRLDKPQDLVRTRDQGYRRNHKIGSRVTGVALMSNGAHRRFIVNDIDPKYETGGDFVVASGAAWLTATGGVLSNWTDRAATEYGKNTIKEGPAASGKDRLLAHYALAPISALDTYRTARKHTLSKGAQDKQAVIKALMDKFGFPTQQYRRSVSMDGMEAIGEEAHAREAGADIIHNHIIVPCGMRNIDIEDLGTFLEWAGLEAVSFARIMGDSLKRGDIKRFRGTFSLNPHSAIQTFVGHMPALATDEARRMWETGSPDDTYRTVDIRTRDLLSIGRNPGVCRGRNTYVNALDGTHVHAVDAESDDHDLDVLGLFEEAFARSGGQLSSEDMATISAHPKALPLPAEMTPPFKAAS